MTGLWAHRYLSDVDVWFPSKYGMEKARMEINVRVNISKY